MADKNKPVSRLGDFGPERERIVREYASGNPLKTFADRASDDKGPKFEVIKTLVSKMPQAKFTILVNCMYNNDILITLKTHPKLILEGS